MRSEFPVSLPEPNGKPIESLGYSAPGRIEPANKKGLAIPERASEGYSSAGDPPGGKTSACSIPICAVADPAGWGLRSPDLQRGADSPDLHH